MNFNQDILINKGINHDIHPALHREGDLYYLLNGDVSDFSGSGNIAFVTNVLSNELCYEFPEGHTFYGSIYLNKDQYAVFTSDDSKGYIHLLDTVTCTSKTVVSSECLKFTSEVKGVYRNKVTDFRNNICERTIYWVECDKPMRYLNIDDCIPKKSLNSCNTCTDIKSSDLDCDALLFNKPVEYPCIDVKSSTTGNLPNGAYQFAIAFSADGIRQTDYFIYPDIIKVHSNEGYTFGIDFKLDTCVETYYDEYELVMITNRADRSASPQRIGFFDISQKAVFIDTLDETFYTPLEYEVLLGTKVFYESAKDIAINSESLILSGVKEKTDFDIRLAAQNIVSEWVSVSVSGSEAYKYKSFMRDEIYAFDIAYIYADGSISHKTHIPSLNTVNSFTYTDSWTDPQNPQEITVNATDVAPNTPDHPEFDPTCELKQKKVFEIYNTALPDAEDLGTCAECEETVNAYGKFAYWHSEELYPNDYPNLGCTPIRHHKFPDHCVNHIHDNEIQEGELNGSCESNCVNIMTVRFKNIPVPKDCNGDDIPVKGYIIYVSDRSNHKSVLHKGLLYNTRNFELDEGCENVQFHNYPFNDLQPDKFLLDKKRKQGPIALGSELNSFNYDQYTYHSPDIHYIRGGIGTELKLYTNEVGRVQGKYHFTEDFPKYQLLSPLGRIIAQAVGITEGILALNGNNCTTTTVEKICKTIKTRTTNVNGFPMPNTSGTFGAVNISLLPAGTGSIAPALIGLNTTPDPQDYTQTVVGDAPCAGTPECEEWENNPDNAGVPCIPVFELLDFDDPDINFAFYIDDSPFTSPVLPPPIDNILGSIISASCKLKVRFNIPEDCVVEDLKASIVINDNTIVATVGENGVAEFDIIGYCDKVRKIIDGEDDVYTSPITSNLGFKDTFFLTTSPKCCCSGDKEVRTTKVEEKCVNRINILRDKEWHENLLVAGYYYQQGIEAAQTFLKSTLKPKEYAIQYTAQSDYNSYTCCGIDVGNSRRLIQKQLHLQPVNTLVDIPNKIDDVKFHNWCNERADYIKLHDDFDSPCVVDNTRITHLELVRKGFCTPGENSDNCTDFAEFSYCSEDGDGNRIESSSYYAGTKLYNPNQYGELNDYISRKIGCVQTNFDESEIMYGGDVHITKMSLRRKMPLFNRLPLGLPNNTSFETSNYFNLAYPTFWLDVTDESIIEDFFESAFPILNFWLGDYNLEPANRLGECVSALEEITQTQAFSTTFGEDVILGIVQILEDVINGGSFKNPLQLQGLFYTHITGIANFWVESPFVNDFREYNENPTSRYYPLQNLEDLADARDYHAPEEFLYNLQYNWCGIDKTIMSKVKNIDYNLKCCDTCDSTCGDRLIYSLQYNEEGRADNWLNFLPNNYQLLPSNTGDYTGLVEVDDYNLFLAFEDAVYVTQQDEGLITDAGNKVYLGTFNAFQRRLKRLAFDSSGYSGCIDKDSIVSTRYGVYWFDRKRKKFFNYAGQLADMTGNWQSWFNEYLSNNDSQKDEIIGVYDGYTDRLYYTNNSVGWTISFNPKTKSWVGFHSFLPASYKSLSNNFLSSNELGIWKHNRKNHYQTYYNKFYPFEIGTTLNNKFMPNKITNVKLYAEFVNQQRFGCEILEDKFFDKFFIHNYCGSTGVRNFCLHDPNSAIPISDSNNETPVTKKDCTIFTFNEFRKACNKPPYFCYSEDGQSYATSITTPKKQNTEFGSLTGDWFRVHLIADNFNKVNTKIRAKLLIGQNNEIIQ